MGAPAGGTGANDLWHWPSHWLGTDTFPHGRSAQETCAGHHERHSLRHARCARAASVAAPRKAGPELRRDLRRHLRRRGARGRRSSRQTRPVAGPDHPATHCVGRNDGRRARAAQLARQPLHRANRRALRLPHAAPGELDASGRGHGGPGIRGARRGGRRAVSLAVGGEPDRAMEPHGWRSRPDAPLRAEPHPRRLDGGHRGPVDARR